MSVLSLNAAVLSLRLKNHLIQDDTMIRRLSMCLECHVNFSGVLPAVVTFTYRNISKCKSS